MTTKKFIIRLIGYSCTGKSSVEKILLDKLPGVYLVSYDSLKWNLSNYDRDRDLALIKDIALGLFESVCRNSVPVLLSAYISTEGEYEVYKSIVNKYEYSLLEVRLTAPNEVLLSRFRERIKDADHAGTKISVTDEALFLKNLSKPFFVPSGVNVYDTSILKPADIADRIIDLLNKL
ncbi:MAG: AAA family ATPase [Candidatus Yanofskybacteria bacterium]|nr:AAA family ATPase [Candidatus Yanofskybacteria bacterium]